MDSPHGSTLSLSRSPSSTSAFAPGPHRRSHPNLQHLSLAPLTPKYPINPSDYEAYVNPDTSELHTSGSLSEIAGLPSPGGILTNSPARSRATSRTRHLRRKTRSTVAFKTLEGEGNTQGGQTRPLPHGAVSSQGLGGSIASAKSGQNLRLKIKTREPDANWLLQTGLALTEGSRESKGQSWLVKRASSTSLNAPIVEDHLQDHSIQERIFRSPYASGRNTPNRSRRSSRDRRRSRRELAMTPAAATSPTTPRQIGSFLQTDGAGTDDPAQSRLITTQSHGQDYSEAGPDWADSQTQAEIAAELANERATRLEASALYDDEEEEDDEDREWWREDRYGAVDFDGQWDDEETQDEVDVQRAVREGGFGVGVWFDNVVDVFLKLEDGDDEEAFEAGMSGAEVLPKSHEEDGNADSFTQQAQQRTRGTTNEVSAHFSEDSMEAAPEDPKSVWDDVAWFSRLVIRTARS